MPIKNLLDYLAAGDPLERFLDHFPSVTRAQAVGHLRSLAISSPHVRILLDESLPRPLGALLIGHEVSTVRSELWTSLTNGELLRRAAERFDVVVTADQNLEFQQNLKVLPIAVVVMIADSNRLESLEPELPPTTLERDASL